MNDEAKMSFLEHLSELRKRILWSLFSLIIPFIPAYVFSEKIFDFLMQPIIKNLPEGSSLIFTRPAEGFLTYLRVSFFSAIILAFPFILYQSWRFIAPALYKEEKKIVIPFILFGTLCFLVGALFCYYIASPPAFRFLLNDYSSEYIKPLPSISEALSFFMALIMGFGLIFEFPLIVFLLSRLGFVNSNLLREKRKYAILASALIAAVLTPTTDAISMLFMLIPLLVFYELGILVAWIFAKEKATVTETEIDMEL